MKWRLLFLCLLAAVAGSSACAVKNYPRRVSTIEKGYTNLGWAVDKLGTRALPKYVIGRRYSRQRQSPQIEYSFYWNTTFKREPELFYPPPQGLPDVQVEAVLRGSDQLKVELIKWHSQYWPQNPDFALRYETYTPTQTAYAVYVHRLQRPNAGVIIISHDWIGQDINRIWRQENLLEYARLGYDSVLIQQPYHGLRSLPNTAFSGEYFISGEVARINEAMCQSVTDIRSMRNWLRRQYQVVGLKGKGLGGTASLMASVVDKDFDFVIAWRPPASPSELIQVTPQAPFVLQGVRLSGLDEDMVKKVVWVSSPSNYEPAISTRNVLIIAGMGDRIVPPSQPEEIMQRWGPLDVVWYAGGHLANFQKRRCRNGERKFLAEHLPKKKSR